MAYLNGKQIIFSPHVQIGPDTSDATATGFEILQGYTAYGAEGTKITGHVVICQSIMVTGTTVQNGKLYVKLKSLKDASETTLDTGYVVQ